MAQAWKTGLVSCQLPQAGELAPPLPCANQVAWLQDSSQAGQLSYHSGPIQGLELAHPNIYFIHDLVGM